MNAILKWGGAALLCAGGAGAWYFSGDSAAVQTRFSTVSVVQDDFVSKVQATGTLEPQELVDVGAQVTGEIKEFGVDTEGRRVDYGSEVKAGQLLARIDDTIVELDIKRAEAQVAQAQAQILSSEAQVAQAKASISQATANKNKADRDLSRAKALGAAQLKSAQAQLESELRNRDYTRISTPVDGTIVVRQVNVGQTVVSSMNATTLFLVARDLTKMQIWASVNEADIAKVKPGQEVRYTVDALPNENFTGTVNKIRPNATMSSNVVTYIVEVDIDNPDRKLLPYMSANANFIVKEVKDALLVPDAAFDFRPNPDQIAEGSRKRGPRPSRGEEAEGEEMPEMAPPAIVWRKVDDKTVAPVRVIKGDSDGTRTIVTLPEGEELKPGDELVTGVSVVSGKPGAAAPGNGQSGLFGMNGPKRRQRGTGGVEAKPGQSDKGGRPGPPM